MPKPLQVVAEVNEEDIPRVAVGQTVLLRTDAFAGRRLEGKVHEITPMGDAVAKTYRIRIALPDDTPLHVGMSVEANVVTREKAGALLVPADAVQGQHVFVVDGNRVRRRAGRDRHPRHAQRRDPVRPRRGRARRLAGARRPRRRRPRARRAATGRARPVNLVLDIALTHVRFRVRQTLVAVAGVATGVGFSIMMAALMEGSQDDFMRQLIDALPHITVSDERRAGAAAAGRGRLRRRRDPRADAGGAPARHQEPDGDHGLAGGLGAGRGGALDQDAGASSATPRRDVGASVIGIDPHREPKVSMLATQMRQGTLASLYRATNAIILGDRLAEKIGARVGSNITVQTSNGARINAQVVGLFRSGIRAVDESTAYVLIKTAQVLAQQTGLVNELRVRVADAMAAHDVARRIERETGYKSVSWQEAHEDLLSAFVVRNVIMYTVVGAILLVASFGTYNIISTITHEKTRDIAILKSLGLREAAVRRIFVLEALMIGLIGALAGWALGYALTARARHHRDQEPDDRRDPPAARLLVPALRHGRRAWRSPPRWSPATSRRARRRGSIPVDIIRGAT